MTITRNLFVAPGLLQLHFVRGGGALRFRHVWTLHRLRPPRRHTAVVLRR